MRITIKKNVYIVAVRIVLTIEEDEFGDLNSELIAEDIQILEALEIIREAQEELYLSRINLN